MFSNVGIARELIAYMWEQRLWWLIPMVACLLVIGLVLIFASVSGISPFIYTLF